MHWPRISNSWENELIEASTPLPHLLPGQVTRIKMRFDRPGRYVWHCHILSHEDHEMMRPYHVGPLSNTG